MLRRRRSSPFLRGGWLMTDWTLKLRLTVQTGDSLFWQRHRERQRQLSKFQAVASEGYLKSSSLRAMAFDGALIRGIMQLLQWS
jgi:hypothetical protein